MTEKYSSLDPTQGKWRTTICSLNFLLSIIGYSLAMALLSPFGASVESGGEGSGSFTYPFRFVQLIVALLAFFSVRDRPTPQLNWKIVLFIGFWFIYFARAFWDLVVSPPYNSEFAWRFAPGKEWYFMCYVIIDFCPLLAIWKGWNCIDFSRVLKWILLFGGIGLLFTLRSMHTQIAASWTGEVGRFSATQMLHTQALGYFGCNMAILSFWAFFNYPKAQWKIASVFIGLLAAYMMLKSGSRGPVFGFAVVVCTWFSVRNKNFILAVLAGIFAVGAVLLLQDQLLSLIKEISPTLESRMRLTIEGGDTSGRDVLWGEYWAETLRNPVFGFQLDRLGSPHSMILDGFMMFGIFAGGIVTLLIGLGCVVVIRCLRARVPNSWWLLLLLMLFTQSFTGGRFSSVTLQAPLLLLFIWEAKNRKIFTPILR